MKSPSRNIHSSFDFTLSKRFQLHLSELKRCGWLAVQLTWAWCSHRAPSRVSWPGPSHYYFHILNTRPTLAAFYDFYPAPGVRVPTPVRMIMVIVTWSTLGSRLGLTNTYKSNLDLGNIIYLTVPWVWWARARRNRQKYLLKANLVTSRHTE